jgi:hypothetical protein
MLLDLVNQVISTPGIPPGHTLAVTTQGVSADFSDAEFSIGMIVDVDAAALTVANVTSLVVQCEESTDGSTNWTVIPGMVATVTAATAKANCHQVVRGQRTKQYVRGNANTLAATTTTGAFPVNATIISQRRYVGAIGGFDLYPGA